MNAPHQLKKRVLVAFGTRPEAIKMAPLIQELKRRHDQFDTRICVTAQHREMLDQVLELFEIEPDYDLNLMQRAQSLTHITIHTLAGIQEVLQQGESSYDIVLVVGDTTTAFAASLAAFYEKVAVGHVEAGLRTHNLHAPWPEELNRRLVGVMADVHFAPTSRAKENLLQENTNGSTILVTGNTVIDALLSVTNKLETNKQLREQFEQHFAFLNPNRRMVLVTGHRRENFGEGFLEICRALKALSERDDIEIVYPVHLNPNVRKPVNAILGDCNNVHLIEPQDYLPFVYLMNRSHLIITDSGGIQEEAPSLGKPVLVMRESTERPEAVEAGTARLVGAEADRILKNANELLDDNAAYQRMAETHNPYGDGHSAKQIVDRLAEETFSNAYL